jgi:para-nitrobenzyl esterase
MVLRSVALLALVACGSTSSAGPDARPPDAAAPDGPAVPIQTGTLITLADGKLRGAVDGGSRKFLGIPFAQPPVGDLRWRPPAAPTPWSDERDATQFGNRCPQPAGLLGALSVTEDCLYLNVWVPEPAPTRPAPVMLWLHGGGNTAGSASDPVPLNLGGAFYDGRALAETYGVVVVTTNYRLGPLGFYVDPDVGAAGNQGLLDQRAAMQWVQANIGAFGGDPANVLLFGQSAGSWDVCLHVAAPGSAGLFAHALSESGGCTTRQQTKAEAAASTAAFRTALGCTGADAAACLRAKAVADLLVAAPLDAGVPRWSFAAVVDGDVIPDQPRALYDAGKVAKVPYLLGSNADEGTLPGLVGPPVGNEQALRDQLAARYGAANVDAILALYPVTSFKSANAALQRIVGDANFVCATHDTARRAAAAGLTVRMYNFAFPLPVPLLMSLGATHGAEIAFVFDSVEGDAQATLGATLRGYWTRFAATGDPNGGDALVWPAFDGAHDVRLSFDADVTVVTDYRADDCTLWRTIYDASFQPG